MAHQISVDPLPPYKHYGRYVCDFEITELHLFDTGAEAKAFAKQWQRGCNVGWLAPTYKGGQNHKPTLFEALKQVTNKLSTLEVIDHRKGQ